MALRNIFKISRKTFFNPSAWLDFQGLKNQNIIIWNSIRDIFRPPEPLHNETFEEAMKRLNINETDVKQGASRYRIYALLFVVFGAITFAYSFYLLFRYATLAGLLLGLCASSMFLVQAFKYDFWSLQMRKRRLGITFEEWKNSVLGVKGPNND